MARKKLKTEYAIAVTHPDGVVGWLTKPDASVETFATEADASKRLERWLKDTRYTWTLPIEVRLYKEERLD